MTRNISFDEMIAQRSEAVGIEDGSKFAQEGFGRTWYIQAPDLADAEWVDELSALHDDFSDGEITSAEFRADFTELMLGDQAEEFRTACDERGVNPVNLINWALQNYREAQGKADRSRRNSQRVRARAKRR